MNEHDATEQAYKNGYEKGRQEAMKWIPVTERLPEYGSDVFVCCNDGSLGCRPYYGFFEKITKVRFGKITLAEVTHWMPLPDAPKGE